MDEDDLFEIERASRHLTAALESFHRMSHHPKLQTQYTKISSADEQLIKVRSALMKKFGVSQEEVDGWSTP